MWPWATRGHSPKFMATAVVYRNSSSVDEYWTHGCGFKIDAEWQSEVPKNKVQELAIPGCATTFGGSWVVCEAAYGRSHTHDVSLECDSSSAKRMVMREAFGTIDLIWKTDMRADVLESMIGITVTWLQRPSSGDGWGTWCYLGWRVFVGGVHGFKAVSHYWNAFPFGSCEWRFGLSKNGFRLIVSPVELGFTWVPVET